jgi:hypothetical protein
MLERNKDVIAQPRRGRVFPFTVTEVRKILRERGFAIHKYLERLHITFRNSNTASPYGEIVAVFYPTEEMVIYSFAEEVECQRARWIVELVLQEFAELEKSKKLTEKSRAPISIRAYHSPHGKILLTKRLRRRQFTTLKKPKSLEKDERIVCSLDLI